MDSKYAYVRYLKTIRSGDMNDNGRLVELNYPLEEGAVELITAEEFRRLKSDFSGSIDGAVIKQDNLVNMLSFFVDRMEEEVNALPSSCHSYQRFRDLKSEFWLDGRLVSDHSTPESQNDLAGKVYNLQEELRIDKLSVSKDKNSSK